MTLGEIKTEIFNLDMKKRDFIKFRDSFIPTEDLNSIFSSLQLIISKFPNIKLDDGAALCESQFLGLYETVNKCNGDLTIISALINESITLIDASLDELKRQKNAILAATNTNVNNNKPVSPTPVAIQSSTPSIIAPPKPSFKTSMSVKE